MLTIIKFDRSKTSKRLIYPVQLKKIKHLIYPVYLRNFRARDSECKRVLVVSST